MLGALAKYIFGSMVGDAPEATAPELQYHTREVNDWLLVDMPDQAIDDEDMDSESDDDDEILTALPLLMAEEVISEPSHIVPSYKEVEEYLVCDKLHDKVDKTHSVPSAIQHHSSDKTQGNFVDKAEAVFVEVEDNFLNKIQDISVNAQENSNSTILDKPAPIKVQRNPDNVVQEFFDDKSQFILSEVQSSSGDEIKNDSHHVVKAASIEENSINIFHDIFVQAQGSIDDEVQNDEFLDMDSNNEIHSVCSETQENSDANITEKAEEEALIHDVEKYKSLESYFCAEIQRLCEEYECNEVQNNSYPVQGNLNLEQKEFYLENCNRDPITNVPKRLYSQVVKMGARNQNASSPMQNTFDFELGKNYDRCVRIFGDEVQEASDDEMNESSDDEMNENSDAEAEDSSDNNTRLKPYNSQLSSDEESEDYSDDETTPRTFADYYKRFHFVPREHRERRLSETKELVKQGFCRMMDMAFNHNIECIPLTQYERAADFRITPQCWYAYHQTMQEYGLHALLIKDYFMFQPTKQCPHFRDFSYKSAVHKKCRRRSLPIGDKPASPSSIDSSLITNSAEILQNLINQKSSILPSKTGVVLEHIKELKPVQQAIQLENRKYLTRSQLNRQNRNYMYQSSTKTNRRRNLQRNHSGANNNRKC